MANSDLGTALAMGVGQGVQQYTQQRQQGQQQGFQNMMAADQQQMSHKVYMEHLKKEQQITRARMNVQGGMEKIQGIDNTTSEGQAAIRAEMARLFPDLHLLGFGDETVRMMSEMATPEMPSTPPAQAPDTHWDRWGPSTYDPADNTARRIFPDQQTEEAYYRSLMPGADSAGDDDTVFGMPKLEWNAAMKIAEEFAPVGVDIESQLAAVSDNPAAVLALMINYKPPSAADPAKQAIYEEAMRKLQAAVLGEAPAAKPAFRVGADGTITDLRGTP